ncbi:MAG: tryptophan-rich sensory protein [Candidatus Gastranaerophilales bacterium]|nr:tryptophan-rich sensory protein [Candidatus Gastranaerophilales bacterium]
MFDMDWYNSLVFPAFAPPAWVFAPVWFVLYVLMFISLAFYIISDYTNKKSGYIFFATQLLLNLLWPPVFFGLKSILGGLIIVVLLDIFVFLTTKTFCNFSKWACVFLIPYFIWILYATYLNFQYLLLN